MRWRARKANTVSAVHNVRMSEIAKVEGYEPTFGQSPFALARGEVLGMLAGAAAGWVQDGVFGGTVLGLQALAIHDAVHLTGQVALAPQIARGVFALALVLLAWQGSRSVHSG